VAIFALSLVLLFMSIYALTTVFKMLLLNENGKKRILKIFDRPFVALATGIGTTAAVHSSSLTTSLSVLLAATEKISPKKLFPFILGANVGTTVTALLASIGRSETAIAIAICHFLVNAIGVLIFFPIPFLRDLQVKLARWTANLAFVNLAFAFGYLIIIFYALPFLVIFISEKF
jgi:sodium-dependent phosphate cotransporter